MPSVLAAFLRGARWPRPVPVQFPSFRETAAEALTRRGSALQTVDLQGIVPGNSVTLQVSAGADVLLLPRSWPR